MNFINETLHYILIDFSIDDRLVPEEALFHDDLGISYQEINKLTKTIAKRFAVKTPVSSFDSIAGIRKTLSTYSQSC